LADSKKHATTPDEEKLYEWNARAIITTWGGRKLYGYAIKDWSGLYSSYYLPKWERLFEEMKSEITEGKKLDYEKFMKEMIAWEDNWITLREEKIISEPAGNSVVLANKLWNVYRDSLTNHN
jgi:alpha-N-acetylglucosaminidase